MFREEICSIVRELLEVRVVPLRCAGPVQPGRAGVVLEVSVST